MDNRLTRLLAAAVFLLAIPAVFTLWSQVGGQYHLDLMFWPWKLGLGVAAAGLVASIAASLAREDGTFTRGVLMRCSLLIVIAVLAGVVTYYYHLNEPQDQEDDDDPQQSTQLFVPQ